MRKVAVISAILEEPSKCQKEFNTILSKYKDIIKGRMGIPFSDWGMGIISITVVADIDLINSLTGRLGKIPFVSVKTAISKKDIADNDSN